MKQDQYQLVEGVNNPELELFVEFEVIEKWNGNKSVRYYEPVDNENQDQWDDEASSGKRINRDKVNGW